MSDGFQLIDLVSQPGAVRKLLAGYTDSEKLGWLSGHGKLDILAGNTQMKGSATSSFRSLQIRARRAKQKLSPAP